MVINIIKILALLHAGIFTIFALLCGAKGVNGIEGILLNFFNAAPWLLVWISIFVAWEKPKIFGLLFLTLAIASVFFFHTYQWFIQFAIISLPLFVIGILFLLIQSDKKD